MVEWLTVNMSRLQMYKSDPGQLQELKQWLNGLMPKFTHSDSFLKNLIGGLMVEWLTANMPLSKCKCQITDSYRSENNGLMVRCQDSHTVAFLKNSICGLMVEWLTENMAPLQMQVTSWAVANAIVRSWRGKTMVKWLGAKTQSQFLFFFIIEVVA